MREDTVLVIGADSLIGSSLVRRFAGAGHRVIGTTRRFESLSEDRIQLDLSGDVAGWQPQGSFSLAILAAAITGKEACRRHPEASTRINVHNTFAIARSLAERGVFVIYLSTNLVFDGESPWRKASDPVSPRTEYGRQKAETEQLFLTLGGQAAIVRFTKVLGPGVQPILGWVQALRESRSIQPFRDMVMAPIPLAFAADTLYLIAARRLAGISQVSANKDVTYAQAADRIAQLMGADRRLVQPVDAAESELDFEAIPRHTTLDMQRLTDTFNLAPVDPWQAVDSVVPMAESMHRCPAAESHEPWLSG